MLLASGNLWVNAASADGSTVRQVADGDTIILGNGDRIRYIGIDAPETHIRDSDGWAKVRESYGEEARLFNTGFLEGKQLRFENDTEDTDRYGRKLRYVYADGVLVNARILEEGLAFPLLIHPNLKHSIEIKDAFRKALKSRKNLYQVVFEKKRLREQAGRTGWYAGRITGMAKGRKASVFTDELTVTLPSMKSMKRAVAGRKIYAYGKLKSRRGKLSMACEKSSHFFIE